MHALRAAPPPTASEGTPCPANLIPSTRLRETVGGRVALEAFTFAMKEGNNGIKSLPGNLAPKVPLYRVPLYPS